MNDEGSRSDADRLDWLAKLSTFSYREYKDPMTDSPTYGQVVKRELFTIPSQHVAGEDLRAIIDRAMTLDRPAEVAAASAA